MKEVYKEILNRYADDEGYQYHLRKLTSGSTKVSIIVNLLSSKEAENIYQSPNGHHVIKAVIARRIQKLLRTPSNKIFVQNIYYELLNRKPSYTEIEANLSLLKSGTSRLELLIQILKSEECFFLLAPRPPKIIPADIKKEIKRIWRRK